MQLRIRNFQDRLRKENAARVPARNAAMNVMAGIMVHTLANEAPRDTNRYVRGWIQAGRGAGVEGVMLPPLRKSKVHDQIVANLVGQSAVMRKRVMELEAQAAKRKKGPSAKMQERLATARGRLEKADDALKRFVGSEAALAMMRKVSYVLIGNEKQIRAGAVNIEVKDQVYGGTGALVHGSERSVLRLHNLEPHSTPVERRSHTLAKAKNAVKGLGMRNMRKKYIEQLRNAARMNPAAHKSG